MDTWVKLATCKPGEPPPQLGLQPSLHGLGLHPFAACPTPKASSVAQPLPRCLAASRRSVAAPVAGETRADCAQRAFHHGKGGLSFQPRPAQRLLLPNPKGSVFRLWAPEMPLGRDRDAGICSPSILGTRICTPHGAVPSHPPWQSCPCARFQVDGAGGRQACPTLRIPGDPDRLSFLCSRLGGFPGRGPLSPSFPLPCLSGH